MGGAALFGLIMQGGPPALVVGMTVIKLLEYTPTVAAMLLSTVPVVWLLFGLLFFVRTSMLRAGEPDHGRRASAVPPLRACSTVPTDAMLAPVHLQARSAAGS